MNRMNTIMDKINLLQLGVGGVLAGFINWISTNNVGIFISFITAFLILLLTIRRFIITTVCDIRSLRAGKLFDDSKPNQSDNGNGKNM